MNYIRHGIAFPFAAAVFLDPMRADLDASRPEDDGMRRKTAGRIRKGLFIAVYTMRNGVIRMISARRTNS
jgi:uncharacterized DUF497 family protein